MDYNAIDVAKWLLTEGKRQRIPITHMKLQKLLYYAQAYTIGMTGEPLFNNKIEAWIHGLLCLTYTHNIKNTKTT